MRRRQIRLYAHLFRKIVRSLVPKQRLIHKIGKQSPVLTLSKTKQIFLFTQFELIGTFPAADDRLMPGAVSAAADLDCAVIQIDLFTLPERIIALHTHGSALIIRLAVDAASVVRIDIDNRKFTDIHLNRPAFSKVCSAAVCKLCRYRQHFIQIFLRRRKSICRSSGNSVNAPMIRT